MGATYTRQSSYTDGDTITAAHTNDEFDQLLAAFQASDGHTHDGTANEGGPISKLLNNTLTFGAGTAGTDITITFDGETNDGVLKWMEDEDYFEFSDDILIASTEKIQFGDTASFIQQSTDGTLRIDGEAIIDLNASTRVDVSGDLLVGGEVQTASIGFTDGDNAITIADGGGITVVAGASFNDQDITNVGSIALDTITNDGTDITLDSSGDIILDAGGANVVFKDDGTSILDIANNSSDVELTVSVADKNFAIKGTDGSSAITALDIDMALAGKATFNGDVVVGGDLTVTGDDITMGTNTAGNLLIADGTNFNSIAVGSLSEISTVANDDVFLAVDTSGGGLKKIARSAIVAGLASSAAISNVVEDTTPQLGGDLDTNSHNILIDDAHFIADENGNEQIIFQTTSSAVNQFDITNAATGNGPTLSATGGDTNINLNLTPKGSGVVQIDGSNGVSIDSGAISIKNSGSESYIRFYCESSNAHYVQLQAPAHDDFSGNHTVVLPNLASTLATTALTETLTNKTLTSPKINEDVAVTSTATELNILDGATVVVGEINALDLGSTAVGNAIASKAVVLDSSKDYTGIRNFTITGELDAATLDISGVGDIAGNLTLGAKLIMPDVTNAKILVSDGTSYEEVAVSGDVSIANTGAVTIASGAVETAMINDDAITEAKIADDAVESEHLNNNVISGQTEITSGLADADELLYSDGGTLKKVGMDTLKTYFSAVAGSSSITTTGALNSGSITSGFGSIDNGSSTANFGATTVDSLDVSEGNITNVGSIALDSITSDNGVGTAITFSVGNVPNTQTAGSQTGNITPDFSQYTNFILTLTGNIVLQDPGDEVAGQSGIFVFVQDGTGGRTLSHADDRYHVAGGSSLVLSTGANDVDVVPYFVQADGTILLGAIQKDFVEA